MDVGQARNMSRRWSSAAGRRASRSATTSPRRGRPFVILDANERIGDAWRRRWDSLRLFTPARYDGLPGLPFPGAGAVFPTKDEMADYLEAYAARFELPVRTGARVDRLSGEGDRYVVAAGDRRFEADNVVVATGAYQQPAGPRLRPGARSRHRPAALQRVPQPVAAARRRRAGRGRRQLRRRDRARRGAAPPDRAVRPGHRPGSPFRVGSRAGPAAHPGVLVARLRVLTVHTPVGGKSGRKACRRAGRWSGSSPRSSQRPVSSGCRGPSGLRDGRPYWRTAGSSTPPT